MLVVAAVLAAGVAVGGAIALAQSGAGVGSSGTGAVGTGTIVTATPTTPTPAGPPSGTSAEQTHPSVLPRTGHAYTRFTARLTLADAPGHSGVLATDYRLQLSVPLKHVTRDARRQCRRISTLDPRTRSFESHSPRPQPGGAPVATR